MPIPRRVTSTEGAILKKRLLASLPASRFEMETLTRLAGIHATRKVPTACVECKRRPKMLINPDFVEKYCTRDEHLFLLVMHELWHVLLAHTRMYPQMTQAHNIAFDAIINAGLMQRFPAAEYRGFFEALNPADKFPSCLLRPPEGWPNDPQYPEDIGPEGTTEIIRRLYPPHNRRRVGVMPLYEEVLDLLIKSGMDLGEVVLIGNHDGTPVHDPFLKDAMSKITEKWPDTPTNMRGMGFGMRNRNLNRTAAYENARRTFSNTLRQCLGPKPGRERNRGRVPITVTGGNGVLINPRDRLASARKQLGAPQTLWAQPTEIKARIPEKPNRAHLYLDVSGSMNFIIRNMLGLLLPYVAERKVEVYQFSTEVDALSLQDLRAARLKTTGGTDINCVLAHALEQQPPVEKVLVLTDGAVGDPLPEHARGVEEQGMKLYIVMPDGCMLSHGVERISKAVVKLPQPER